MRVAAQVRIWLIAAAVAAVFVWLLSGVLTPFLIGMTIAYALDPLCDRLEAKGLGRTLATVFVLGGFVLLATAVVVFALPLVWSQVTDLISRAPQIADSVDARIQPVWDRLRAHMTESMVARVDTAVDVWSRGVVTWLAANLRSVAEGSIALFNVISTMLIAPLVAFYMLRDWDRMIGIVRARIPRHVVEPISDTAREINEVLAAWLRGVLSLAGVLMVFYAVGLSLLGVPYGLLIGLLAGAIAFIPYLGPIVGGVPAMVAAVVHFDSALMWAATFGVFALGQILEGNVLTPWLVGRSVNLHEVWTIFAVMAGGALLGLTGVLIAIPVAAAVGVVVRRLDQRYLESRLYDPKSHVSGESGTEGGATEPHGVAEAADSPIR